MLEAAGALQSERAGSLAFRFVNEDALLARARERIVFGWGEYGRNVVRDEEGKDQSVLDGHWIIRLGVNGIVGFVTTFGPLLIPVLWARRRLRNISNRGDQVAIAGVAFTLTILSLDLIPNGLWSCYSYLIAGVLTRGLRELGPRGEQREWSYANSTQHPQAKDPPRYGQLRGPCTRSSSNGRGG